MSASSAESLWQLRMPAHYVRVRARARACARCASVFGCRSHRCLGNAGILKAGFRVFTLQVQISALVLPIQGRSKQQWWTSRSWLTGSPHASPRTSLSGARA
eukprot:6185257-Pleurochrysis_carterae.AAC.1